MALRYPAGKRDGSGVAGLVSISASGEDWAVELRDFDLVFLFPLSGVCFVRGCSGFPVQRKQFKPQFFELGFQHAEFRGGASEVAEASHGLQVARGSRRFVRSD